jgi:hypothetical protein
MSRQQLLLCLLTPLLIAPISVYVAAACPTTSHFASDAAFQAFQPEPAINFVAEGRIGDRGGAATFELDLGQSTAAPATQAQYNWISGQAEPFTLSYNNISGVVTFQLGGRTLNYSPGATFTDIYIRTRATQAGTSVVVNNLVLDGCGIADQSGATGDGLDYLRLVGGTLGDGFVLTGNATLNWGAIPPANSHLAFQIKVGTPATIVPVDGATWSSVKAGPGR